MTSGLIPASARSRESNMEALRIVAMSMILIGHFFFHGFSSTLRMTPFHFAIAPLFICGVNLFFLISGWFGIRFSLRSLVRLVVVVFCFISLNMLALEIAGVSVSREQITDALFFPVSRSRYWFIMVYMAMMILAPLLNAGLRAMGNRQLISFIVLFSLFNMYGGSLGNNYVNGGGYTLTQGIWMYCVAACLRRNESRLAHIGRKWYLAGFILFSLCSSVVLCLTEDWEWMDYNSPLVAAAAVSLFLYFTRLRFRSIAVNSLSAAAFGCYMLQDGLFGHTFLYKWMDNAYLGIIHSHDHAVAILLVLAMMVSLFVSFWGLSFLFTPVAGAIGARAGLLADRLNSKLRSLFRHG